MQVIFVFLDEGTHNLYQLKQWLQPLKRLAQQYEVSVLHVDPLVAQEARMAGLTEFQVELPLGLVDFLNDNKPKVLLYPNQNTRNFYASRYAGGVHVWVSHGESDKAYMFQNTLKRYDLYFASGEVAAERVAKHLRGFNPDRIQLIGRPQLGDSHAMPSDFIAAPNSLKVFYAPTWEGVTRATRYSSIASHGLEIVQQLLAAGHQVVYRPHPLSGTRDPEIARANQEIIALLNNANALAIQQATTTSPDSLSLHRIDSGEFGWQLDQLDFMITDISAVAYDWLATGKPLVITEPVDTKAVTSTAPLYEVLPKLAVSDLAKLASVLAQVSGDSALRSQLARLQQRYFGSNSGDGIDADSRFFAAIDHALELQSTLELADRKLEPFNSRGRKLGWLRYPNFAIRQASRFMRIWAPVSKRKTTATAESRDLYAHFSDPFNGKSVWPVAQALFEKASTAKITLATNQVTTLIAFRSYFWLRNLTAKGAARHIQVLASVSAADAETLIETVKPERVLYLKDHPANLSLLRLGGVEHVLENPESDPFFDPSHSLIMYDRIVTNSGTLTDFIERLPAVSRPKHARE